MSDHRLPSADSKQSVHFHGPTLEEIKVEATRLERTISWTVQRAWKVARKSIRAIPSDDSP